MEGRIEINKILNILQDSGLSREESLIFQTLIKYGQKGATVRDLTGELPLIRTTIYSILRRLVEKEQVIERKNSETSNRAKLFSCIEPSKFYNQVLSKKSEELKRFEEQQPIFTKTLQELYMKKRDINVENLDNFILPFFQPLLKKNWKVYSQVLEKTFGVNIYEYQIISPDASKAIPYCVYNVYDFEDSYMRNVSLSENIELSSPYFSEKIIKDLLKNTETSLVLYFYIKRFEKRIMRDDLISKYKMSNFRIQGVQENYLMKKYPSLNFEVIPKKGTKYQEILKIALLPLKNKLFCLMAESQELLVEMYESIIEVEKP